MLKDRIVEVCGMQYHQLGGVLPPQVCLYCFGCPIATLVVGVSSSYQGQRGATLIPDSAVAEVEAWLSKIETQLALRR